LKKGEENCVNVIKGLGTWPETIGTKEEEGTVISQNKFEILKSRVMQCGVEERIIRRVGVVEVQCFKYKEKGHKCKECPL